MTFELAFQDGVKNFDVYVFHTLTLFKYGYFAYTRDMRVSETPPI